MKTYTNLQTLSADFLLSLGENAELFWTLSATTFMALLILIAVKGFVLQSDAGASLATGRVKSKVFFSWMIAAAIIILRIPSFSLLECNVDESQWIAGAFTLLRDSRFWISVDGTTSGPLVIYPLTLIHYLGGSVNYGTVKLVGAFVWAASALCLYHGFVNLLGDRIAKLAVLPFVACVAVFSFPDYLSYNGELISILLISISLFFYCKSESTVGNRQGLYLFLLGFFLGCVSYAKLQATPGSVAIALGTAIFLLTRKNKNLVCLLIGGLVPSLLILTYLLSFDIVYDFWQSYIVNNLLYAQDGSGFSLPVKQRSLVAGFIGRAKDTRYFFISQALLILFSFLFLFKRRRKVTGQMFKLAIVAFLALLGSLYGVFKPGNYFPHYLLLLIVPFVFLSGILLGIVIKQMDPPKHGSAKVRSLMALIFIAVAIAIPFSLVMKEPNIAFKYAKLNSYYGKHRNVVVAKILEYTRPDDRLAIWGYANIFYVQTGLAQGTREAHSIRQIIKSRQQKYYIDRYINDMKTNCPAVFMEVVNEKQLRMEAGHADRFESIPEMKKLIYDNYTLVASFGGTRIFVVNERI